MSFKKRTTKSKLTISAIILAIITAIGGIAWHLCFNLNNAIQDNSSSSNSINGKKYTISGITTSNSAGSAINSNNVNSKIINNSPGGAKIDSDNTR